MKIKEINSPGQLGIDNDLIDRFTDKGWEIVGEGQDQMVFGKPGSRMLLKVVGFGSLTRQAVIRKYIAFFRAHQRNPHFPRVGVDRTLRWKGRQYYAYTQERLLHLPGDEAVLDYLEQFLGNYDRDPAVVERDIPPGLTYEQVDGLTLAIDSMFAAGFMGGYDLGNVANIMQREDGQLVIVDPFSAWDDENLDENTHENRTRWLYHATYKPLLGSIKQHGLGGDQAQAKWEDSKPGVVYLAKDPEMARSFAETSDVVPNEWLDQIIVFKIDADKLNDDLLKIDQNILDNQGDTLEYHGVIPVNDLSLLENFDDGRKPGRKGLSKRVGIPSNATLGQLEKIAKSSTGERRRMAQWQLNMRRGKAQKNK